MAGTRHAAGPRTGFTLIELLVVLAIIAVLFAMLLPSMQKARELAKTTSCASIERQYGIAFGVYLNDFNGAFPYVNQAKLPWTTANNYLVFGSAGQVWIQVVGPYFITSGSTSNASQAAAAAKVRCPANPWKYTGTGPGNWAGSTYAMNGFANNSSPFPYSYGIGSDPALDPSKLIRNTLIDRIRKPSSLCLIADTPNLNGDFPYTWTTGSNYASCFLDRTAFTAGSTSNNAWVSNITTYGEVARDMSGYVRVNHNLGWNTLKVDGSVQWISKQTMDNWGLSTGNGTNYAAFWLDR